MPPHDPWALEQPQKLLVAGNDWFLITPDDDNDLATLPRAIYVGEDGILALMGASGTVVQFPVVGGSMLQLRPRRVMVAGTTGTTTIIGVV